MNKKLQMHLGITLKAKKFIVLDSDLNKEQIILTVFSK